MDDSKPTIEPGKIQPPPGAHCNGSGALSPSAGETPGSPESPRVSETYLQFDVGDGTIFRMDRQTGYGFFHSRGTGELHWCDPMLTKLVSQEFEEKRDVSFLRRICKTPAEPDNSRVPSLQHIALQVTDKCNMSCLHCLATATAAGREMAIPLERLLSLIDEATALGLTSVSITGGEPLTWRPLGEVIRALGKRGLRVQVDTNGILLDRDTAAMFAELNVRVSVGLDSHVEALHDRLRGTPGAFKKVCNALALLKDSGAPYDLNTCVYKDNYSHVAEFFRWCRELGVETVKLNPIVAFGRARRLGEAGLLLGTEELLTLAAIVGATTDVSIMPSLPAGLFSLDFNFHRVEVGLCDLNGEVTIQPDGHLSVCGPGYKQNIWGSLGSVGDDIDLAKIWTAHPVLLKMRGEILQGITGICRKCVFSKCCSGFCRVLTYDTTKSWVAPFPLCQELYETQRFPAIYLRDDLMPQSS